VNPKYLENHNDELRKHDQASFVKVYRNISEKAQKNTPKGDWNLIRAHNIRKFFNSTMLNAGADSFHVEFFMGHTLDDTRAAYFRANPEKLRELYQKYVPYLTIEKAFDPEQHPDFIRLKNESETYARAAANAAVERNELIELRTEMEKMKEARESSDKVTEIILQLQKTDPTILNTLLEALKTVKS
jgi:hypothetical protein